MTKSVRERELERAAQDFVRKVDMGLAKSKNSYDAFKAALALPVEPSPDLSKAVEALKFYRDEWRGNMEGDGETPGLSRCWQEPTDALWDDAGDRAREALAHLTVNKKAES